MTRLNGFKPDWAEKLYRGRVRAFGKGYALGFVQGREDGKAMTAELIVSRLSMDSLLTFTLDTNQMQRVVEIVEDAGRG